jgi:hypothetical protein
MRHALTCAVALLLSAGCVRTVTTPTPVADTETLLREFSSLVVPGGSASRSFDVSLAGPIAVTLTSTTPPGVMLGLGVGISRSDGSCALGAAVATAAGAAAQITVAAEAGAYCAKVYDLGTLDAPLPFTISISRP